MASAARFYLTTPIFYVNDKPHIGHAYTMIACDVLARFMRLDGREVMFLTGTDEHGQKVEKSAAAQDMAPIDLCNAVSENFRELTGLLNISNDDFIRTTEPRHYAASQGIWQALEKAGDIYLGKYAGWYAVSDEAFYAEDELSVDEEGVRRAPSGAAVEWMEEPSYFFRLSAWQDRLLELYDTHPDFVLPKHRLNEVRSFVAGGLHDLSISRTSFNWGIPVPGNTDHIMYVWLDALTNYITAVGYPDENKPSFQKFWPVDVHVVGKDILRFHAVYWPAFLMAAGVAPPKRVFAHGWLINQGQKMSKSLGNVIDPAQLVADYGLDPVRYFFMREVPFGNDGYYSHTAMVRRINSDLANDFGNLCQRVLSMIHKNCGAKFPTPGPLSDDDNQLKQQASAVLGAMRDAMDVQSIHIALSSLFDVVQEANRYVDRQAPWRLRKEDPERMATVLYVLADCLRQLAILAQPVVPDSAAKMLDLMAVPAKQRDFNWLGDNGALVPGTDIPKPTGVFPRLAETEEDTA